jgi:D-lactate dehydrogenase (cytochrome)
MTHPLTPSQLQQLHQWFGSERFSTGNSARDLHISDISPHACEPPSGVVWPETTEEVSNLLTWTYREGIPVTPWGAGTSTEGNPLPVAGGLVVDMTRMNRVLDIRSEDLQVDVQPGVFRRALNKQLADTGLFFPVDPGADATIGGMIANNASGVKTIS